MHGLTVGAQFFLLYRDLEHFRILMINMLIPNERKEEWNELKGGPPCFFSASPTLVHMNRDAATTTTTRDAPLRFAQPTDASWPITMGRSIYLDFSSQSGQIVTYMPYVDVNQVAFGPVETSNRSNRLNLWSGTKGRVHVQPSTVRYRFRTIVVTAHRTNQKHEERGRLLALG